MQRTAALGAPGLLTVEAPEPELLTDEVNIPIVERESVLVTHRHGPMTDAIHLLRCPRCDVQRPVAEDEPVVSCADPDCDFHGPNPHYRGPPSDGAIVAIAPGIHHVRCPRCLARRPVSQDMLVAPCANPYCWFIGVNHEHVAIRDPDWVGLFPKSRAGVQLRCPQCRTPTVALYSDKRVACPSIACNHISRNPAYEPDGYSSRTPRLRCPRCDQYTPAPKTAPVLGCIHDCDFIGANPRWSPEASASKATSVAGDGWSGVEVPDVAEAEAAMHADEQWAPGDAIDAEQWQEPATDDPEAARPIDEVPEPAAMLEPDESVMPEVRLEEPASPEAPLGDATSVAAEDTLEGGDEPSGPWGAMDTPWPDADDGSEDVVEPGFDRPDDEVPELGEGDHFAPEAPSSGAVKSLHPEPERREEGYSWMEPAPAMAPPEDSKKKE